MFQSGVKFKTVRFEWFVYCICINQSHILWESKCSICAAFSEKANDVKLPTDLLLTTLMLNQITQRRMGCWVVDNEVKWVEKEVVVT